MEQQNYSINRYMNCDISVVAKVTNKITDMIPVQYFGNNKFGGIGTFVQEDETNLNYKAKSHRSRSPSNKTDALVIIEYRGRITRAFKQVIPNKEASTMLPIICENVRVGTTVFTDEHKSYSALARNGFIHQTFCHKYEFVNKTTSAHT